MSVRVALVGCGRWGSRLLGALVRHPRIEVAAVVDTDRRALARAARIAPGATLDVAITCGVEAAIIATPASLHAAHARRALALGLDVLVEKPLAVRGDDAIALAAIATMRGRVAMVGHVLRYHPLVEHMIELAPSIGRLERAQFRRFTTSQSTPQLWALAPHDIATLHALDPSHVTQLAAEERDHIVIDLALASGLHASIEVSTTARSAVRQACLIGSDGRIVIDELTSSLSLSRRGHVRMLELRRDALRAELDHFVECVERRRTPRTSFDECIRVVQTLERAQLALEAGDAMFAAAR